MELYNFERLYDAAMAAREEIRQAVKETGVKTVFIDNYAFLEVGEFINFRTHIIPQEISAHTISCQAVRLPERRDCTVDEIRQATAASIAQLRKLTREGRIAELEAELAELKAQDEEEE